MTRTYQPLTFVDGWLQDNSLLPQAVDVAAIYSCWFNPAVDALRFAELRQLLDEISALGDNWDGYGGVAISTAAARCARSMLLSQARFGGSLPLPEIAPTSSGTIALEWQNTRGEAVIELGETKVSGFVKPTSSPAVFVDGDNKDLSEYWPHLIDSMLSDAPGSSAPINRIEYNETGT